MAIAKYDRVRLMTNRYKDRGARRGMVGWVQEVWNDGEAFEVNFEHPVTGDTINLIEVLPEEIRPA